MIEVPHNRCIFNSCRAPVGLKALFNSQLLYMPSINKYFSKKHREKYIQTFFKIQNTLLVAGIGV